MKESKINLDEHRAHLDKMIEAMREAGYEMELDEESGRGRILKVPHKSLGMAPKVFGMPRNRAERRRVEGIVRRSRWKKRRQEAAQLRATAYHHRRAADMRRRREMSESLIPLYDEDERGNQRFVRYL